MYRPCGRRVAGDPSATWWVSVHRPGWPDQGRALVDDDGHRRRAAARYAGSATYPPKPATTSTAFIEDVADRRNSAGKP